MAAAQRVVVAGVGMIPFVKPGAQAPYPEMGAQATRAATRVAPPPSAAPDAAEAPDPEPLFPSWSPHVRQLPAFHICLVEPG